ncbi:thioesterase domain-containing protein [Lentzea sp. HUAS TT2]|uniref:thioesterase domain-containing protein n=1 Tax=Lentzea sp. HUAS TT2 TaxID=3447454 RepID=UPI003F70FB05
MPVTHGGGVALFPGQGTQAKGMGAGLFDRHPEAVSLASDVLGYDIERLCLEDPDGRLDDTRYTQPAIFVVNALSYWDGIAGGEPPADVLLGHSLGEYNALLAARAFDFETGLKLVAQRSALMGSERGGAMLAVVGASLSRLEELLAENGLTTLDVANRNTPNQNVLSGPAADIDRARETLGEQGLRVARVRVSAAFHSRYMKSAREEFAAFLRGFRFSPLTSTVIANATARPYRDGEVASTLSAQLDGAVRWSDSVLAVLSRLPAARFREVGGNGVLTRMVRQIETAPATPVPAPRRVFTIAFAGGDDNSYRPLGEHLADVEVVPLERPGRGRRHSAPFVTDPDALVEDLTTQLRDHLRGDEPFAVYGHSLGARLAFEVCRRLRAEGLPAPVRLVVSGECGPSVPSRERDTWQLTGDAFWAHLDELGGVPHQLRQYEDLMAHYERVLRADFTALGRYRHRDEPPLDVPITVVTGDLEPFTEADVAAWQRETTAPLVRHRLPGDHFFIRAHWPELAHLIEGATP